MTAPSSKIRRLLRASAVPLLAAALVASCSKKGADRGGLMLEISSDGNTPIDRVDVEIDTGGNKLLANTYNVPAEAQLPTTVAIVSSGNAATVVSITVIGWNNGVPVDRRDAIVTQIPADRVAALRVVLSARCSNHVSLQGGVVVSDCAQGTTCDPLSSDASCGNSSVAASTLVSYQPGAEGADAGVPMGNPVGGSGGNAGSGGSAGANGGSGGTRSMMGGAAGEMDMAGAAGATETVTVCGDGLQGLQEDCDDGNTVNGDGCSVACTVEPGYRCPVAGTRCVAATCGDGIKVGAEQCDDSNTKSNDGCSALCKLEPGFVCSGVGTGKTTCKATVCGDNKVEGFESCDDGNTVPFDGCSPTCTRETKCTSNCMAACGDGIKADTEECDDGNTTSGDGCSSLCKVEAGFTCQVVTTFPPSVDLPVVYRDMLYAGTTMPGPGHPDFQQMNFAGHANTGLVGTTLDVNGKPTFASTIGTTATQQGPALSTAINYCWWYNDVGCDPAQPTQQNPYAKKVTVDGAGKPTVLTLATIGTNIYRINNQTFFPIDDLGWNSPVINNPQTEAACGATVTPDDNFSFTTEVHFPFTYQGGEKVSFTGDDDFWLFINGQLAIDLGGVHTAETGAYTLGPGLVLGKTYDLAMFQAERYHCQSTFELTITGFGRARSSCSTVCGDGQVEGDEDCDDGAKNGTSASGCGSDCQFK